MANTGPKPQTDEQKKAKGTFQPCRAIGDVLEFPVVESTPAAPEWVIDEGLTLWNEMVPLMMTQRVLTNADLHAMAHMCKLHAELIDGYSRKIRATASDLSQLRMYFSEFGMTPASRTRIGKTSETEEKNKFKRNGNKAST